MEQRPEPPMLADERDQLLGFVEFLRATIELKVAGLSKDQLLQRHEPSEMTLLGLVRHLAVVEDSWFTDLFAGEPFPEPWASVDWDADRDWEWHTAGDDELTASIALWHAAVARSRAVTARHGFDDVSARATGDGHFTLRWLLLHMVEEYGRHAGHADLLREAIDGATGQ